MTTQNEATDAAKAWSRMQKWMMSSSGKSYEELTQGDWAKDCMCIHDALSAASPVAAMPKGKWLPIETAPKDGKGLWLKLPDNRIEWGAWRYSPNAQIEAFGTYPLDEFGNRITSCFLPFSTQPVQYFIERRKSPSSPPSAPIQAEKDGL